MKLLCVVGMVHAYPSLKNDPDLHNIFPNVDVFAAQLSCKSEGFSKNWEVASEEPEEC